MNKIRTLRVASCGLRVAGSIAKTKLATWFEHVILRFSQLSTRNPQHVQCLSKPATRNSQRVAPQHIQNLSQLATLLLVLLAPSAVFSQTFTATSLGDHGNVTVMEVNGNYDAENADGTSNVTPRQAITNEFYKTHKDEYDFIVFFSNFDFAMPSGGQARGFYEGVKNDILGIGLDSYDKTNGYNTTLTSSGRLQGTIDMGNLASLVADPQDPKFEETLGFLSHAMMHRWSSYIKLKDVNGVPSSALLDTKGKHWSFLLDSAGSLMGGNTWYDNGDGTFTSTTPQSEMKYFSPLDLYLMGMVDRSAVPSMLLIDNSAVDPDRLPEMGVTVSGTGRMVAMDEIIAALGQRVPDASTSQKTFKTAFIFITRPGTFTGDELQSVENIRNGVITRFSILTDGKSIMEVSAAVPESVATNPGIEESSASSRTLPPSLNDAVAWLASRQETDGSWADLKKTAERDTAEAALALKSITDASKNYEKGVSWLAGTSSGNVDFLSRKIEALAGSGQDLASLVNDILSRQNGDGGWGSGDTFSSSAGDTAMALKALATAGSVDQGIIAKAVACLTMLQNSDGSWGGEDNGGMVRDTAQVLSQLGTYRSLYSLEDAIGRGSAWLVARQNSDGGFGNSPSTVYDSGEALKTLRELNVSRDVTNKAVGYLQAQQAADGSWNSSSYQTALALDVLFKTTVNPDLSIQPENISTYPATIKSLPQSIVLNAEVWNLGQTGVEAKAALYRNEVSDANKIDEQTVSFAGESTTTIAFMATAEDGYEQQFIVVIDPDNLVKESNKLNNKAAKTVKSVPNLDFEVLPADITLSANPADMAQDVTITAVLKNRGTVDAYNVLVKFLADDATSPYEIITKTIDVLPANSTVVSEVVWRTNRAGVDPPVQITVELDPQGEYSGFEFIRTNNKASVPITVNPNGRPNLTMSYRDMVITPSPANERGAAIVSALLKNEGFSSATDITVNLFYGVPGYDGVLAGTKTIPLIDAGGEMRVNIDWPDIPVAGDKIIYVQTVYNGEEIRADDNDAFVILTILSLPDLMLSANSITFNPVAPKDGDQVKIQVTIQNAGEQTASKVRVTAYDGGTEIDSSEIAAITGKTEAATVISFNGTGKQGAHEITVVADPNNDILENNKDNNRASRSLGVQNGSLWLTEPIISPNGDGIKDSTQVFFSFDVPATVFVQVVSRLGNTFRTFSEPDFANTTAGNITWDGLDNNGVLVNDGQYRIEVRDADNRLLGTLSVQVDTNRSPITDAIGTKYLLNNNLTCNLPDIIDGNWKWFPDESAIAAIVPDDPNTSEYPAGIYTVSADGVDVQRITSGAWKNINGGCEDTTKLPCERYSYLEFAVSPDSANVAAIVLKEKAETFYYPPYSNIQSPKWTAAVIQLALIDRDGRNILSVEYNDQNAPAISILDLKWTASGDRLVYRIKTNGIEELWSVKPDGSEKIKLDSGAIYDSNYLFWSPDGSRFVYRIHIATNVEELWSVRPDGTEKLKLDSETNSSLYDIKWSPDSSRIGYLLSNRYVFRVTDLSGDKKDFSGSGWDSFSWLTSQKVVLPDYYSVRIIDVAGDRPDVEIPVDDTDYSAIPSPTGSAVAIVGTVWIDWMEAIPFFKVVDPDGKVLYEWQDSIGSGTCIARVEYPVWSPGGIKIAFNEVLGIAGDGWDNCYDVPYVSRLVTADIKTKEEWVASTPAIPVDYDSYIPVGWLSEGAYVLSKLGNIGWWTSFSNDYFITDIESGETKSLLPEEGAIIEWTNNFISPLNRYYTYYREVDAASVCANKGVEDLWSMRSLLNLTVDLRVVRKKTALVLKGTASDLNFEGYKLEYADVKYPDVWNPVQPPSDAPVLNEILTSWVPPTEGSFYVRLTVWDKAGNTATDRKRITWGLGAILTNVYKTQNLISPNIKDGILDTVEVHYRVMEPANLEFAVLDQNKTIVRNITKSYTAAGDDFIEWDGRDNDDNPVPDGLYIITVLDFELAVEVDNTVPDIGLSITDISNEKPDEWLGTVFVPPYSDFFAHATDKNIIKWVIEYGEGENPQEWLEYMRGGTDLPQQFSGDSLSETPLKEYSGVDLEWLAGKKFRITAVDTAGNVSTTIRNLKEELFVYQYKAKGYLTDLTRCGTCDCLTHAPLAYSGKYPLIAVETFFHTIISMNVQYKVNGQWIDTPTTTGQASAFLNIDWVNSYSEQNITALRVKALDDIGQELYSNEICIEKPIDAGSGGGDGSGGIGGGGGGDGGGGAASGIGLEIGYPEQTCGLMSNPVGTVSPYGLMSTGAVQLYSGGLYVNESGTLRLLQPLEIVDSGSGSSLTKWSVKPSTIDASGLAEGNYSVTAAVFYEDLSSGATGTASAAHELVVDRTMPVVQLYFSPCTERKIDSNGAQWRSLLIQGVADDNVAVQRYDLVYGLGDNPTAWTAVTNRWIDQDGVTHVDRISGSKANKAILGNWDVTSLIGKKITLKLEVLDAGGNVNCVTNSFTIKDPVTLSGILIDPLLFSPNEDNNIDTTTVQYEVNQDAVIEVKAYELVENSEKKTFELDTLSIKDVLSGFQYIRSAMGIERVQWDGTNDAYTAVDDGWYGLEVVATDQCGYKDSGWKQVEVDIKKPTVSISYPKPSDPLYSTIISVTGSAEDLHFSNYLLEVGEGELPIVWKKVSSGTGPVKDGFLGEWNSYGKLGRWSFKLTATDTVGNQGETTTVADLGNRQELIKDLSVLPRIFSPNDDTKLETTTVTYEVADAVNVLLEFVDSNNAVNKTITTNVPSAGLYTAIWDGKKDDAKTVVTDGQYTVKLTAMLASNPTTSQTESVSVVVDATPPTVEIEEPLNDAYLVAQNIRVKGSIGDPNFVGYSITYEDGSSSFLLDSANQSREKYVFGQMNGLEEGSYTLTIAANDLAQNEIKKIIPFTIDRTPPAVKLDTPQKDEYYGGTGGADGNQAFAVVNVTGSIVEKNFKSFNLRYGSGEAPTSWKDLVSGESLTAYPSPYAWKVGKDAGIEDGPYTLSLYAKDKADQSGEAKVKITIDNTLPTVAITSHQEEDYVKQPVDVTGTAHDLNFEKYVLEFSAGQCAVAFKWAEIKAGTVSVQDAILGKWQALPEDGDYCIRIKATDKVSQTAEAKVNVTVDTHPPAAPQLSGEAENRTSANISWPANSEPDLAGYNLYRNGELVNTELIDNTELTYLDENLTEGVYFYTLKALDFAGWESPASNEVKVRIDLTGPDAYIRSPKDGDRVGNLIDIKGTAYSSDDFKQYRVSVGQGAAPSAWALLRTSPVPVSYDVLTQWDTINLADNEMFSIKLEAEDIAGNITTRQITVVVDNTPPDAPELISAGALVSDVTTTWRANDESDLAGYLLFRNDQLVNVPGVAIGNLKPYLLSAATTTYLDKALPDGVFKYYLMAMDEAGNTSDQSNTLEVTIDTHPPHADIIDPLDQAVIGQKFMVRADSPDLDVASLQFQYQSISSSPTTTADWQNLGDLVTSATMMTNADPEALGLAYGDYRLRAVATDKTSNPDSAPGFITITYADLTPPTVPTGLTAKTIAGTVSLIWTANTETDLDGYNVYRDGQKINELLVPSSELLDENLADGLYSYTVTAVDTHQNESKVSSLALAKVYAPVVTQPYTPVGQNAIQVQGTLAAANSSVEMSVAGVGGSGLPIQASSDADGNFVIEVALTAGENRLTARVTDSDGNVSKDSNTVVVVYNDAPAAPTGLVASVQGHDVGLSWNQNAEPDLLGYSIFRDGVKVNAADAAAPEIISASSLGPDSYDAWSVVDNDPFTFWMPQDGTSTDNPAWWEMDLAALELISRVSISWGTDTDSSGNEVLYAGKDFEIQVWSADANAWITQAKATGNAVKDNVFDFSPAYRTDKIRIFITDSTDVNSAKQVRLAEVGMVKDNLITFATTSTPSYDDLNLPNKQYEYTVTAVDTYGFESRPTGTVNGDVSSAPLSAPVLSASALNSDVILTWIASPEPETAGYNVYKSTSQGWVKVGSTVIPETAFVDASLTNGTYAYQVTASDAVGNESPRSNTATATVAVTPPTQPNLAVTPTQEGALQASWTYNGASAAGFNIYRALTSGGPYAKVNSGLIGDTSYLDTGLTLGVTYFYVVAAVDGAGNEGAYSNEASGMPADTTIPAKPLLYYPTIPGHPLNVAVSEVKIIGEADPYSQVTLRRADGTEIGRSAASSRIERQEVSIPEYAGYGAALSPNGKMLAYTGVDENDMWGSYLMNIESQQVKVSPIDREEPHWSPNGEKILYYNYDYDRLDIYDVATNTFTMLTDGAYYEYHGAWSPDGSKVAFQTDRGWYTDIWVKDLNTGELTQLSYNGGTNPAWSPDGTRIAYNLRGILAILNLNDGTETQLGAYAPWDIQWSADGTRLCFANADDGQIYVVNADASNLVPVSVNASRYESPRWLPSGKVIYVNEDWDTLYTADSATGDSSISLSNAWFEDLAVYSTGLISYGDENTYRFVMMTPAGRFEVDRVPLLADENTFYAEATSRTGIVGPASDPISLILDMTQLAELAITAGDVYLYPPYPIAGEQMAVNAVVTNTGQADINNVEVDLYLWNALGQLELLKSETIPTIAAGSSELVTATWDSTGKTGDNRLVMVVDPYDKIAEMDETNNLAVKDFYVADHEGLSMSTTVDKDQYGSNQNANISIAIRNTGPDVHAVLNTMIEDTNGMAVSEFAPTSVSLAYAAESNPTYTWNTGSTYAGSYVVHSLLKDTSGATLAENTTPFTITSDSAVDLTVVTDKIAYEPGENVATGFTIKSTGTNSIIPALQAAIAISSATGTVLYSEVKSAANLLPGASVALNSLWNTGFSMPGDYTAAVTVSFDGGASVTKSAEFMIKTMIDISGSITASPSVVPLGNTLQIAYALTNMGNADAVGYTTRITVLDPDTQTIMQTSDETMDIASNTGKSGQILVDTTGYGQKTYVAVLQTLYQNVAENIASASFTVKDLTPPVVIVESPTENTVYGDDLSLSVLASDNASGVAVVEYQRDNGAWQLLAVADSTQGRYAGSWSPVAADNGSHTFGFRATDKAGNASVPVLVDITIRIQTDTTPPSGSIIINDGAAYTNSLTATLTLACTDLESGCSLMQFSNDGITWSVLEAYGTTSTIQLASGDGQKTVFVQYKDDAGNPAIFSSDITLDTTPPVLTLSTLPDGASTNNATLNIAGTATDNIALQRVTINDTTIMVNADGAFSHVITLATGSNSITTTATDLTGNKTTDTRTITLDQTAPVVTISHPSDNSTTNEITTTVTGTVDKLSLITVLVNGAPQAPDISSAMTFSFPITYAYGLNHIQVTAIDLAGNPGMAKRTVTFDNVSPALSVTYPSQDITTNQASMLLQGSVTDLTITSVTVTHNGTSYTPEVVNGAFEQSLTFVDERTYAVIVTAMDEAGNMSTVQRNIIYDITPPTITINPVSTPTNIINQLITGTMESGATVTVTCSTASAGAVSYPTATTWETVLSDMSDGTNTINAVAVDSVGNVSNPPVSAAIVLDRIAPDTSIVSGPAVLTNMNTASFGFSSSEQGSTFECKLDDGTFNACDSFTNYNSMIDGTHTLMTRATDPAGNPDQTPAAYTWTVDTIPPIAAIIDAPPSLTNMRSASMTVNGDDVIAYQYNLDDGAFFAETATSTQIVLSGLLDGTHRVLVKGKDSAGNWQRDEFATFAVWTVDITPPVLVVSTLLNGSYTNNPVLNIAGTASDANGIQSIVVSGQTVTPATTDSVTYTFSQVVSLGTGSNAITTVAMDNAGNTTTDIRTIILDRTAPVVTITNPADNSLTNTAAVDVTGFVDKTATVSIKVNGISPLPDVVTSSTFTFPVTLAYDGNLIEVTAVDLANNQGTAKRSVTLDNLSPALAITSPNQDMGTNLASITLSGTVSDLTNATLLVSCPTASIGVVNRPTTTTWSVDITNMQQGTNIFTATAIDEAGNSTNVVRNIIYSSTPITIDPVKTPTNISQQLITGTMGLNSTVTVSCSLAVVGTVSYPTTTTWQAIIADMQEGTNVIDATATDLEGRPSDPVSATIVLDTHAPVTTPSPAPGTYYNVLTATLVVNEPAMIYYTFDGSMPTNSSAVYNGPQVLTETTTLKFFAVDMALNPEEVKSVTYTVVPDTVPPVTTITSGAPNYTSGGGQLYVTSSSAFALFATDDISGVASIGYRLDNGTLNTYASPFSLVTEGNHTIGYRSADNAANLEAEKSLGLVVDNAPPVSAVSIGGPPVTVSTTISITATDSASGVQLTEYAIDSGSWTTYSGGFTLAAYSQGTHTISYRSTDNVMNVETPMSLIVQLWTEWPTITTAALADGTVGAIYSQALSATGGTAPYLWSISTGTLPAGLLLNSETGVISGTPLSAGTSTITVLAADANNMTDAKAFAVTISIDNLLSITTTTLPSGATCSSYNQTLAATGGNIPYTWSVTAGTLPAGLKLTSSTGVISGSPTTSGISTFTVQVKDASNISSTRSLSITITDPLKISTGSLPEGTVGSTYDQSLAATGGSQPYEWSTTTGDLPAGLSLDSSTGVISGTPEFAGTSTFTVQVKDSNDSIKTKSLTITIIGPLTVATSTLASGTKGTSYKQTLAASGGNTPYTWSIKAGSLPAGLTLASSTGVISGKPTRTGTSTFTVQVKDGDNATSTKSLSISVYASLNISTCSLQAATRNASYSQTLAATGGSTPYAWSVSSGSLPVGLTLNASTGVIAGTPTTKGTVSFTMKVTDANTKTATKTLSISVN